MRINEKILIIGCGSIGRRHLGNLINLGYKNIAVFDSDIDKLKNLPRGISKYENLTKSFKLAMPTVCFVCSPTSLHLVHLKACLMGNMHVFIEKPLSFSVDGTDNLIKLASKKGKKVMVACNWRFNETFMNLKKMLKNKDYGRVISASISSRYSLPAARGKYWRKSYAVNKRGGGVTLDTGSHIINYLEDLFGEIVDINVFESPYHPLKAAVDEQAVILLNHKNNIICDIYMDYFSTESIHKINLNTTKGIISADLRNNEIRYTINGIGKLVYKGKKDFNHMYIEQLRHFFSAIKKNTGVLQDLSQAKKVVKLLTKR